MRSFGTGAQVKLPGPSADKPNVYDFNTTYEEMYNDLCDKDLELYPTSTDVQCTDLSLSIHHCIPFPMEMNYHF